MALCPDWKDESVGAGRIERKKNERLVQRLVQHEALSLYIFLFLLGTRGVGLGALTANEGL